MVRTGLADLATVQRRLPRVLMLGALSRAIFLLGTTSAEADEDGPLSSLGTELTDDVAPIDDVLPKERLLQRHRAQPHRAQPYRTQLHRATSR